MQSDKRLFAKQVDLLYQQAKGAALLSAGAAILLGLAVTWAIPTGLLLIWVSASVISALSRVFIYMRRAKNPAANEHPGYWANIYGYSAGISGLCWGLSPIVFAQYVSSQYQLILAVMATGVCAACLPVFSAVPRVYRIFSTCCVLPLVAWALVLQHSLAFELAGMAVFFLVLMNVTSRKMAKSISISLKVQFSNEDLVDSLRKEVEIRKTAEETALQASEALRVSRARFEQLAAAANEGLVFHEAGVIINANQAFAQMLGLSVDALVGRSPLEFVVPEQRDHLQSKLASKRDEEYEIIMTHRSGKHVPLAVNSRNFDYDGRTVRLAAIRDVSDKRAAEDKVRYLAQHDGLTGLPNRSLLAEGLKQALSLAKRQNFKLGLLTFDLDRFKGINDTLGHALGDSLICAVAERLKQNLRTEDLLARPGGDEFLIVLPYVKESQDLARTAFKILRCFEKPFLIDSHQLYITPSIGISTFPDDGEAPEQLIPRAETAMYDAKKSGGNCFAFYTAEMSAIAQENLKLENQLRNAIDNKEFLLHYQPQLDLKTNKIVGVEALIRWNLPGSGLVAPLKFIPVAEMSGLIVPIGEWVMMEACQQAQDWQNRGADPIRVAVNVSARQFKDPDLIKKIAQCLETTGLNPRLLELELTESIVMEDPTNSAARLNQIRDLGVSISIDDFGTGYSSLAYLKQFPIDVLKIDRSFVRDVNIDPHNAAIVTAILAMARQLQIEVVAEGIETAEQQHFLATHGCSLGQGFYFSKPLPAAECEKQFEHKPSRPMPFSVVK